MNHCFFCSRNFVEALQSIPGFSTARACRECLEKFKEKIERPIRADWDEEGAYEPDDPKHPRWWR